MNLTFDHAVVVVTALDAAVERLRGAGFAVSPGGRHDVLPTENAVVSFESGGYLELLALRDDEARASVAARRASPRWEADLRRASAITRRFLPRLAGAPGVGDFVLRVERLARFAAESRKRGFVMTGPVAMSRVRESGERLAWELVLPIDDHLPFFIEDRTSIALRIPQGTTQITHANGARGVSAVRVRTPLPASTALAYAELFDAAPRLGPDGRTTLELGALRVEIVQGGPSEAVGACAVTIGGTGRLPPDLETLGLFGG